MRADALTQAREEAEAVPTEEVSGVVVTPREEVSEAEVVAPTKEVSEATVVAPREKPNTHQLEDEF